MTKPSRSHVIHILLRNPSLTIGDIAFICNSTLESAYDVVNDLVDDKAFMVVDLATEERIVANYTHSEIKCVQYEG